MLFAINLYLIILESIILKLKKVKDRQQKFSKELAEKCRIQNSKIMVSFSCVTSNKTFNFTFFKKDIRANLKAREALDELLEVMTSLTWKEASLKNKHELGGFEVIPFGEMQQIKIDKLGVTKDTGVHIFRFNSQRYRLCGIKDSYCNVLHIIAYDFNYELYSHGS